MPTQVPKIEIHDESARIVKGFGTVDIFDKAGERLPIEEFKRIMPIIMKRGGIILNRHTNQPVAKILNYDFRMKDTQEGPKEGVYLHTEVFKDFKSDDEVWKAIKKGETGGFSFGGRNNKEELDFSQGLTKKVLKDLDGWEFSYVPSGMNQESTIEEINYIAKEDKNIKKELTNKEKSVLDDVMKYIKNKLSKNEEIEEEENSDDKTLSKSVSTLDSDDKIDKSFINNNSHNKNMTKDLKKVEEVPQANTEPVQTEDPMVALNSKLDQIISLLSGVQKAEDDEDKKDEDKEKKDDDDKDDDDVEKEGDGEKVKLPESEGDEVSQDKPTEGAKGDESAANFLQKERNEIKAEVKKEIMKELINKNADTPRPETKANNNIQKADIQKTANTWAEANKMVRDQGLI